MIQSANKVKYLGLYFCSICGNVYFYGQYNNIRVVLGYGTREMNVVHVFVSSMLLICFNVLLRKWAFAKQGAE